MIIERTDSKTGRLISIDAFRGFTMIAMLAANLEAGVFYPWFTHARVIPGFTFVDLIEPLFYLAIALTYMRSFERKEKKNGTKDAVWSTISRYLALMGLGFLTSWGDEFGATFNWGTLQGIGLAGLVALAFVKTKPMTKLIAGLLIIFVPSVAFLFGEPVTVDFWGSKSLPGLLEFAFPLDDNMVGAVIKGGMLLVGISFAQWLSEKPKKAYILTGAVAVLAIGSLLVPSMWNLSPSTMSPSYCMVSLSLSFVIYLIFRLSLDTHSLPCKPLLWWGRNSLLMYVISEVIGIGIATGDTVFGRLIFIIIYISVMTVIVYLLDRKRWYIKL